MAQLTTGATLYPHRTDLHGKRFWSCSPCDAYVGSHQGGNGTRPLGRLANAELRDWKQQAHTAFDPLWRDGGMSRTEAYAWMAAALQIAVDRAHIGEFDVRQCQQLIAAVETLRSQAAPR